MSALSEYTRAYYERVRTHGQAVADGIADGPYATSADTARAPGAAAPPVAAPDVDPADVRAMDDAEWDAQVEHLTRLYTCALDGD